MTGSRALVLLVAVAAAVAVFAVFYRWERRGRGVAVVQTVMGVLLLDAALYPSTEATALVGVFHPSFGGQNVRLTQLLIGIALVAKACARGLPKRTEPAMLWWGAFFLWYATAGVVGLLVGNDQHLVVSRAYLVIEAGGMLVLTAAVPMHDWLDDRGLARLLRFGGVVAGVLALLDLAGVSVTAHLPRLPLLGFGSVGADAATLFLSLGLLGLAMETTRPQRRPGVLLASIVLVLAHAESSQRAARLDLVVSLLVFLVIVLAPRQRRFAVRGGELVLVGLALCAVVAVPVFTRAVSGSSQTSVLDAVPVVNVAAHVANSSYRQGSVQSRYNEWSAALPLIDEHPVLGSGLGRTFPHYDVGTRQTITYDITNNLVLDLLLRTGAVGLALFVLGFAGTVGAAWRVWQRGPSPQGALLTAMALAVTCGLLAKAMVESVLNEYHLTPLLGFLLGLVFAAAAEVSRRGRRAAAAGPLW